MPQKPTIYLGADHGGFSLKGHLAEFLSGAGYPCVDEGDAVLESYDDYPIYAVAVAAQVAADRAAGQDAYGLLVCRSASGMVMAAGKIAGIRAVAAFTEEAAEHSRADNDANVLALAGDTLTEKQTEEIVTRWLATPPSIEERHVRRRAQIDRLDSFTPHIMPGIFKASGAEVIAAAETLAGLTGWLHIDVADGDFVPATALGSPPELAALALPCDAEAHLMVNEPAAYVDAAAKAGFRRVIAHIESPGFAEFMSGSSKLERLAALDLGSDPKLVWPYLEAADGILLMAVKAGRSGQNFSLEVLQTLTQVRRQYQGPVTVDGGVSDRTAPPLVVAGAERLVSTSYLSGSHDPAEAVRRLQTARGGRG